MRDKEAIEEKYQAQLAEWRADIDKLKARAAKAQADTRLQLERRVGELEAQRDAASEKLKQLRNSTGTAVAELKAGVQSAFEDLGSGVRSAIDAFSKKTG